MRMRSMPSLHLPGPSVDLSQTCGLCVDGKPARQEWLQMGTPVWSPDGERIACVVQTGDGLHVAVGKWKSPAFEQMGPPTFLDDGRIACATYADGELWWRVFDPSDD